MNDEAAFLTLIHGGDTQTRLVFADWLDDHDRPREAALQRVLALPDSDEMRLAYANQRVSEGLNSSYDRASLVTEQVGVVGGAVRHIEFAINDPNLLRDLLPDAVPLTMLPGLPTRGFVEEFECTVETWEQHGTAVCDVTPVRRVRLMDIPLGPAIANPSFRSKRWAGVEFVPQPMRMIASETEAFRRARHMAVAHHWVDTAREMRGRRVRRVERLPQTENVGSVYRVECHHCRPPFSAKMLRGKPLPPAHISVNIIVNCHREVVVSPGPDWVIDPTADSRLLKVSVYVREYATFYAGFCDQCNTAYVTEPEIQVMQGEPQPLPLLTRFRNAVLAAKRLKPRSLLPLLQQQRTRLNNSAVADLPR